MPIGWRALSSKTPAYSSHRDYTFSTFHHTHTTLQRCSPVHAITSLSPTRSLSSHNPFYSVVQVTQSSFETLHSLSHLPWWAVVVSATVVLRSLLTLPLALYQSRVVAKMELLLPTLKEYQEAVKHNVIVKCRRANLPVEEANRRLKKEVRLRKMFSWCSIYPLYNIIYLFL